MSAPSTNRQSAQATALGNTPPASKRQSTRQRDLLIGLLAVLAIAAAVWNLAQNSVLKEQRLARTSLAQLQREATQHPDDASLLYYLGAGLNRQQRFREAEPLLEHAVGIDPEAARLRDEWARTLLGSGQTTRAFNELRQFAGSHFRSADAHRLLGKFYHTQQAWKRAEEELSQAVALDASDAESWAYLAAAHSGHGDLPAAVTAARKAAALRPLSAGDELVLASLLAQQKMPEAAIHFERAIALAPNSPLAHEDYSRWLLDTNGPAAVTLEHAQRALALTPNESYALYLIGAARLQQGETAAAIAPLTAAARLTPDDPQSPFLLVRALHALGRRAEAQTWQAEYLRRERASHAYTALMDALMREPKSPPLNKQMAALLARRADVAGCLRHEATALRCPPDAPAALRAGAEDLQAAGHTIEANALIARAASSNP